MSESLGAVAGAFRYPDLNQRPQWYFLLVILRQALEDTWIGERHRAVALRDHPHAAKPRQGLVGMNERQPERVGDVLLCQRKSKSFVRDKSQRLNALVEADDQGCDPFGGGAPAGTGKVSSTMLSSREPSQVTSKASPGMSPNSLHTLRRGSTQSCTSVSASMPCCAASNMPACRPSRSPGSRIFRI